MAAVILLLVPRTAAVGALVALGVMVGAIGSHLLFLGIEVQGDGGTLFALAWIVTVASVAVLWIRKADIPLPGSLRADNRS